MTIEDQTVVDMGRELSMRFAAMQAERDGYARHQLWNCEDGWMVGYTTERVKGEFAPDAGKFVTIAYRPYGEGSRGGRRKAQQWKMVYRRAFSTRKSARARAEVLYYRHSPKLAKRHGRS